MTTDRTLLLIQALRSAQNDLLDRWVRAAGTYFLLEQGYTYTDAPGLIPMAVFNDHEKELEIRRKEVDSIKEHADQLEEEIQRIYQEDVAARYE